MMNKQRIEVMKQIQKEYRSIMEHPDSNVGLTIGIEDENDIFKWRVTLSGAKDSPYNRGVFVLTANIPKDYPNSPPEIHFKTPIYHLNVNPNKSDMPGAEPLGHICMSCLNWWKPYYKMKEDFTNIFIFFYKVNPDGAYGIDRAYEYRNNRPLYEAKARYFTKKYANPRFCNILEEFYCTQVIEMKRVSDKA